MKFPIYKTIKNILILGFALICSITKAQHLDSIILDSVLVKGEKFKAILYKPKDIKGLKPIVILGGSDGGIRMKDITNEYAKEGFAALNVAYFDYEDLPKNLVEIPIEYFKEPIKWLLNQKYVKASSVAIYGFSRGAELSLILASIYPEISVVIAMSPSNVVWGGWGGWGKDHDYSADLKSAWTNSGKPMRFMSKEFDSVEYSKTDSNADYIKKMFLDDTLIAKPIIPIQKSKAAVLLISGARDEIWPSLEMSESIIKLLQRENHPYPYKHIVYKNFGHSFDLRKAEIVDTKTTNDLIAKRSHCNGSNKYEIMDTPCWSVLIDFIKSNQK